MRNQKINSLSSARPAIDFVKFAMKHYGEEVMLNRALPRLEDGLKPVQRLLFWSSMDIGGDRFVKSAKIAGHCIASYSPHGEKAAYDSMVRMVNERYPLMEGQGNFGGATTEAASARYTEARIHPLARKISADLPDWKSVPYEKNYDDTKDQPEYLPTSLPLILLNSSSGIAMAITSKFPGFAAEEVAAAVDTYFKTSSGKKAASCITAPDSSGGQILSSKEEIKTLLSTGEGAVVYECAHHIEQRAKTKALVVTGYVPEFSVSAFLKKCADMQETGEVNATRNETSAKNGDRIIVEFSSDEALVKLKKMLSKKVTYKMTCLVPTDNGPKPMTLGIEEIITKWCELRKKLVASTIQHELVQIQSVLNRENLKLKIISDVKNLLLLLQKDDADALIMKHFSLTEEELSFILSMKIDSLKKASVDAQKAKIKGLETQKEALTESAKTPEKTARSQSLAAAKWMADNMPSSYKRSSKLSF